MEFQGKGKVLRIYLNKYTHHEKELLYDVIVKKAHAMGIAGAMVFQGTEGFGFCCVACRTLNLGVAASVCQPLIAEFIDKEEKIDELLPVVKQLMKKGGIVVFDAYIDFDSFQ